MSRSRARDARRSAPSPAIVPQTTVGPGQERVLVTGGAGFVGSQLVAKLSADGQDVVVLTRRRERARHLLLLPTVRVVEGDPHDPATLARWAKSATAAVNLIGVLHEHGRDTFERVHVEFPRALVTACRNAGVSRILHMSALAASADAASAYLRSKAAGEAIVAESGLDWTIFRPSVMFGRGDSFLSLFARLAQMFPVIPLACANARFQPVFVGDVASCIARALVDDETIGERYSLCGPKTYTLEELVSYVAQTSGHPRPIVPLGPGLANLQARVMELLPGPLLTRDNLASMQHDSVCEGPFPRAFDLTPTPLEAVAPEYLAPIALKSRFDTFRANSGR
ncbi:MAG TPA: complex I NDUFA9 subunit family protein [Casimicrobiaceae bacterium]|nr:complex I NDUFA9 subunit family protein [Casimicrobiaceae bacterium]